MASGSIPTVDDDELTADEMVALEKLTARVARLENKVDTAITTIGTVLIETSEPHIRPLVAFLVEDLTRDAGAPGGPSGDERMQRIIGALKVEERKSLMGSTVPCGVAAASGRKW